MKTDKKIYLILLGALVLPSSAFAATVQGMVDGAVQTTLYIASGIVVILWVVTGVLFLTALGDPAKLKSAKTGLFAAIAGTVLIIVASGALNLVRSAFNI